MQEAIFRDYLALKISPISCGKEREQEDAGPWQTARKPEVLGLYTSGGMAQEQGNGFF